MIELLGFFAFLFFLLLGFQREVKAQLAFGYDGKIYIVFFSFKYNLFIYLEFDYEVSKT
jgi:hypothetical protein